MTREKLHRDLDLKRGVVRHPNFAHAAAAKSLDQAEPPVDPLSNPMPGLIRRIWRCRGSEVGGRFLLIRLARGTNHVPYEVEIPLEGGRRGRHAVAFQPLVPVLEKGC